MEIIGSIYLSLVFIVHENHKCMIQEIIEEFDCHQYKVSALQIKIELYLSHNM